MSKRTCEQVAYQLMYQIEGLDLDSAMTLARAEKTLHRWAELECGDGNEYSSWCLERDEQTGIPFMCVYPHQGKTSRRKIADRERGALKRVGHVCARYGLHFWQQTDPRGCALYVSREVLTDENYSSSGIAVC